MACVAADCARGMSLKHINLQKSIKQKMSLRPVAVSYPHNDVSAETFRKPFIEMQMKTAFAAIGIDNARLYDELIRRDKRYLNHVEKGIRDLTLQKLGPHRSIGERGNDLYTFSAERPDADVFAKLLYVASFPHTAVLVGQVDASQRSVIHKLCDYFSIPHVTLQQDDKVMTTELKPKTKRSTLSSPGIWIGEPSVPPGPFYHEAIAALSRAALQSRERDASA